MQRPLDLVGAREPNGGDDGEPLPKAEKIGFEIAAVSIQPGNEGWGRGEVLQGLEMAVEKPSKAAWEGGEAWQRGRWLHRCLQVDLNGRFQRPFPLDSEKSHRTEGKRTLLGKSNAWHVRFPCRPEAGDDLAKPWDSPAGPHLVEFFFK